MRSWSEGVCLFWMVVLLITPTTGDLTASEAGIEGKIFYEYEYHTTSGENAFNIERVYLTHRGNLTQTIKYRVTSDIAETGSGYLLSMKYAYIDWSYKKAGTITAGMLPTNAFDIQKGTWGLRYLQKTVMNHYGFSSSADLGIGYATRLGDRFSISAILSNGGGYKQPESNRGKRVHLRFLFGTQELAKTGGVHFGIYGSAEPLPSARSMVTGAAFMGFHSGPFWGGMELAHQRENGAGFTQTLGSVYGRYNVQQTLMPFLRWDTSVWEHIQEQRILAGVEFSPIDGIRVAPNFVTSWDASDHTLVARINGEFRW